MGKLSEMWATLPNMPGHNKPFVAGKITGDDVDEEHDDLAAKLKTLSRCAQEFNTAASALNDWMPGTLMSSAARWSRGASSSIPAPPSEG